MRYRKSQKVSKRQGFCSFSDFDDRNSSMIEIQFVTNIQLLYGDILGKDSSHQHQGQSVQHAHILKR